MKTKSAAHAPIGPAYLWMEGKTMKMKQGSVNMRVDAYITININWGPSRTNRIVPFQKLSIKWLHVEWHNKTVNMCIAYLSLIWIIFRATRRRSVKSSALNTALLAPWPSLQSTVSLSRIGNFLLAPCCICSTVFWCVWWWPLMIPSAPTPAIMPSTSKVPVSSRYSLYH